MPRSFIYLALLVILTGCLFNQSDRDTAYEDKLVNAKSRTALDDFLAGTRLFNTKDYMGARRRFFDIIERYPGIKLLHEAQWMIARSYEEEGDLKNALEEYKLFLKNYPDGIYSLEAGMKIELTEEARSKIVKKEGGRIVGIKLTGNTLKALTGKDILLLRQSGVNAIIVEIPAGTNLPMDDMKRIIDASRSYGFQIFIEINIRDPGWVEDPEARELAYDPDSRKIVKSQGLDLFNMDILANMAGVCRYIAADHPDGIILKGYGYGRYEGLGRFTREKFYKDFGLQLDPEHLFVVQPPSSSDSDQGYPPDFWHWAGWKGREVYKSIGRIMKGCREGNKSTKFMVVFHHEAIDNPATALALYSEDILEANRYRPDYLLITIPKDGIDVSMLSKRFSGYISNNRIFFEVVLGDSAQLVDSSSFLSNINMAGYSGIILSRDGKGF